MNHPAVIEAVVIGIPHDEDGDLPMALLTLKKELSQNLTKQNIEDYVVERVPDRMKLRGGVKFVEKFITTPTGKINRKQMRDMILNGRL
ncbi:hypothetical protein JTB14_005976 [Gonioctena quinquepunctata]|nr:hypothetical protein JTB14_005976 [Gonioctena quinquepunctata]